MGGQQRSIVFVLFLSLTAAVTGFVPLRLQQHNARAVSRGGAAYMDARKMPTSLSMAAEQEEGFLDVLTKQFGGFFENDEKAAKEEEPALPDAVIDPDYKLAAIFLTAGLLLDQIPYIQILLGLPVTALGILFLVQTFRIRFCFDSEAFELKMGNEEPTSENIVVGGMNRWTYDSFANYDFYPKGWIDQPQGPLLVYFKETQTPSDKWNEGPGQRANSDEAIVNGAVPGQVHFFPALCNTKQLQDEFQKRKCAKL